MMRKSYLLAAGLALLFSACQKENPDEPGSPANQDPMTRSEINAAVRAKIEQSNAVYNWKDADDRMLWSAALLGDSLLAIGYKPANQGEIKDKIHLINLDSDPWKNARNKVISKVIELTERLHPGMKPAEKDLLFEADKVLPILEMKVFDREVIAGLREMPEVRYLEPLGYTPEELNYRSESGCGVSPASSINAADYATISPNVKVTWNFYNMNIPGAWSTSTGSGITIALIDTGTSPDQNKLGSQFNSGQSSGRFIDRQGTYVSSWWPWASPDGPDDQCGHGTQMAGLLAAPRGSGGATVGVAYNANLLAIRATGDVVVNGSSEKKGVKNALIIAGGRSDVKVISMSLGDIFWSDTVADGVYYAYNHGKMIFAAAGTSTSFTNWWGVIFPAYMPETVAVTGVKDGATLQRCNVCHSGSEVDFVAVMQRASNNNRTALTLAMSGNQPSTVGGSSAATAITAGIAALVWSTNPGQTRNQVLNRLKNASQFYPSRDSEFGWGLIDAQQAVNN